MRATDALQGETSEGAAGAIPPFRYREIRARSAPADERAIVDALLPFVCADLEIPMPRIRWFRPNAGPNRAGGRALSVPNDAYGLASPQLRNVIWLRADVGAERLVVTLAHECCHLRQFRDGVHLRYPDAALEEDAQRETWHVLKRIVAAHAD